MDPDELSQLAEWKCSQRFKSDGWNNPSSSSKDAHIPSRSFPIVQAASRGEFQALVNYSSWASIFDVKEGGWHASLLQANVRAERSYHKQNTCNFTRYQIPRNEPGIATASQPRRSQQPMGPSRGPHAPPATPPSRNCPSPLKTAIEKWDLHREEYIWIALRIQPNATSNSGENAGQLPCRSGSM